MHGLQLIERAKATSRETRSSFETTRQHFADLAAASAARAEASIEHVGALAGRFRHAWPMVMPFSFGEPPDGRQLSLDPSASVLPALCRDLSVKRPSVALARIAATHICIPQIISCHGRRVLAFAGPLSIVGDPAGFTRAHIRRVDGAGEDRRLRKFARDRRRRLNVLCAADASAQE